VQQAAEALEQQRTHRQVLVEQADATTAVGQLEHERLVLEITELAEG
jgi:hypothetical protein